MQVPEKLGPPTLLEMVPFHDAIFGEGFRHGYIRAKLEDKVSFEIQIPFAKKDELIEQLNGAKHTVSGRHRNEFGVFWATLKVEHGSI